MRKCHKIYFRICHGNSNKGDTLFWRENVNLGRQNFNKKRGRRGHISLLLQNEKASTRGRCMQRDNTLWLQAIVERTLMGLHCPARDKLYFWPRKSIYNSQTHIYHRNNNNSFIFLSFYLEKMPERERPQYKKYRTCAKFNNYSLSGKSKLCNIEKNFNSKCFHFKN